MKQAFLSGEVIETWVFKLVHILSHKYAFVL